VGSLPIYSLRPLYQSTPSWSSVTALVFRNTFLTKLITIADSTRTLTQPRYASPSPACCMMMYRYCAVRRHRLRCSNAPQISHLHHRHRYHIDTRFDSRFEFPYLLYAFSFFKLSFSLKYIPRSMPSHPQGPFHKVHESPFSLLVSLFLVRNKL